MFFYFTQFVILTNDNIELNVQCSDSASRQTFTSVKTAVFVVCRESSQNPCSCLLIHIPTEAFYFSREDTFGRSPGTPRGREKKYYCIFGIFKFLNLDGIYLSPSSCLPFSICLSSPQVREQP